MYVVPAYGFDAPVAPAETPTPAAAVADESARLPEPSPPTGTLSLDITPHRTAQLHVDGFYVGTTDDLGGELTLEAGPHSVEVRAPGYQTLGVNVKIEAGRVLTYRGTLQPLTATTTTADKTTADKPTRTADATPVKQKPLYVIPGCYLGNVPPKDAGLPATCDQSRAKTIRP